MNTLTLDQTAVVTQVIWGIFMVILPLLNFTGCALNPHSHTAY